MTCLKEAIAVDHVRVRSNPSEGQLEIIIRFELGGSMQLC